jgi:hypothetical protein
MARSLPSWSCRFDPGRPLLFEDAGQRPITSDAVEIAVISPTALVHRQRSCRQLSALRLRLYHVPHMCHTRRRHPRQSIVPLATAACQDSAPSRRTGRDQTGLLETAGNEVGEVGRCVPVSPKDQRGGGKGGPGRCQRSKLDGPASNTPPAQRAIFYWRSLGL